MSIRVSKESDVPVREQVAAQVEFLIATGTLRPGDALPSVRSLARQLRIHYNTVSQAYQDVAHKDLVTARRGGRMIVRTPDRPLIPPATPDLDDLINGVVRTALQHGYTLQQLRDRVRDRMLEERPDHGLVLSFDAGMRQLLQLELRQALGRDVHACSPDELAANPGLAIGAVVVGPPGVLPRVSQILPKSRPPVAIVYSSAGEHLDMVRGLRQPSVVAVVSVSLGFIEVARGVLGPVVAARHSLVECFLNDGVPERIPAADILFCDTMSYDLVRGQARLSTVALYRLVSPECVDRIASVIAAPTEQKHVRKR